MLAKFIQLEVGQSFQFEGQAYVKSTPLMGRNQATGQERFIPRSTLVETGDAVAVAPQPPPLQDIPAAEFEQAWTAYLQRIDIALQRVDAGVRLELVAARAQFEKALGL